MAARFRGAGERFGAAALPVRRGVEGVRGHEGYLGTLPPSVASIPPRQAVLSGGEPGVNANGVGGRYLPTFRTASRHFQHPSQEI
jgi:hypothetical protein